VLPLTALLALLAAPLTLKAAKDVLRYRNETARLEPAIKATIGATVAHGVLLTIGLAISRFF
jgi:1,4-dihydroxy-2-naphthoate octaprenyltransferase